MRVTVSTNHLEERLLDQAQAKAPYTPILGLFVWVILDAQPLVDHFFGSQNDTSMKNLILTPPLILPGCLPGVEVGVWGGGSKRWTLCLDLDLGLIQPLDADPFLIHGTPQSLVGVSSLNSRHPQSTPLWAFAGEDFTVLRLACVG